jgi:hypothetical protein
MYLQSIKSVKHNAAKSVNRSILKKSRHIGFGVFIVHSSMQQVLRTQATPGAKHYSGAMQGTEDHNRVTPCTEDGSKATTGTDDFNF